MISRESLEKLRDFIRPLKIAALLVVLVLGAMTAGILEAALPGKGVSFTVGVAGWFRAIPDAFYALLGSGYIAYTAAREYGKGKQAELAARNEQPDDPDGGP